MASRERDRLLGPGRLLGGRAPSSRRASSWAAAVTSSARARGVGQHLVGRLAHLVGVGDRGRRAAARASCSAFSRRDAASASAAASSDSLRGLRLGDPGRDQVARLGVLLVGAGPGGGHPSRRPAAAPRSAAGRRSAWTSCSCSSAARNRSAALLSASATIWSWWVCAASISSRAWSPASLTTCWASRELSSRVLLGQVAGVHRLGVEPLGLLVQALSLLGQRRVPPPRPGSGAPRRPAGHDGAARQPARSRLLGWGVRAGPASRPSDDPPRGSAGAGGELRSWDPPGCGSGHRTGPARRPRRHPGWSGCRRGQERQARVEEQGVTCGRARRGRDQCAVWTKRNAHHGSW